MTVRVAGAVRAEMARADVSARAVAIRIGWSHTALNRRLNATVPFRVDELDLIATALDIPVARFYAQPDAAAAAH